MEIVKYVKVIVPRLSSTKKVLRNKLWHMLAGKNTGAIPGFVGLSVLELGRARDRQTDRQIDERTGGQTPRPI